MRVWLVVLLLLPTVAAEFGPETETGYPIGEGGLSHDPAARFAPEALAALQARAAAEYPDVFHEPPLGPVNQVGPATLYPYYPIVVAEVQRLADLHPEIVRLHSTGKSELGLDLWMLEIANFAELREAESASSPSGSYRDAPRAASPVPLADREVVWIDGGTHSNEYSGVYFVLAVAQFLVESYGSDELATFVVDNRHTWIMPMVNVDGSHAMGRMNANLININRNYPVIWGGEGTDDLMNNPGPEPASEVETRINIEWFNKTRPDYYASVHCCGNLWLFPYGEDGYDPADYDMLNKTCEVALPSVGDDCGPIWSTIYPASGSSVDTAYEYTGASAWGFEMSGRSNLVGIWGEPLTFDEVFVQELESWGAIRHAFENVHLYGAWLEIVAIHADGGGLEVTLRNSGMGNLTGGHLRYVRGDGSMEFGSAQLPAIPVGGLAAVYVNGAQDEGDHQFVIDHPKRIWETTNWRSFDVPVMAREGADIESLDGAWQVPTNPEAAAAKSAVGSDIAGFPVVGALALVAVALLRRRV